MLETAIEADSLSFNTVDFTDVAGHQGLFHRLRTYHNVTYTCHGYGMYMIDNDAYSKGNNSTYVSALDGSSGTYYYRNAPTSSDEKLWFELHLGVHSSLALTTFSVQQRAYPTTCHEALKVEARVSDDSAWVELFNGSVTAASGVWNDLACDTGTYYKSFKLSQVGPNNGGNYSFAVAEVEVFGTFRFPSDFSYTGT